MQYSPWWTHSKPEKRKCIRPHTSFSATWSASYIRSIVTARNCTSLTPLSSLTHLSLGFCANPCTYNHDAVERGLNSTVTCWGPSDGVQGSGSERTLWKIQQEYCYQPIILRVSYRIDSLGGRGKCRCIQTTHVHVSAPARVCTF